MARPPLPIGTAGKIRREQLGPNIWRARTQFRDYDGVTPGPLQGRDMTGWPVVG